MVLFSQGPRFDGIDIRMQIKPFYQLCSAEPCAGKWNIISYARRTESGTDTTAILNSLNTYKMPAADGPILICI